jgi:cellulose synthase/poly-beta-1,6-N-acetylglucosamine synthase-like glycosyltransferase
MRLDERGGKTRAEAAAAGALTGEVIVNTDATIRIPPAAVRRLVAAFEDPSIGCASGRDVSVSPGEVSANVVEGGYVGYEMAVRELETKVGGIVGASGCFYAIRRRLHRLPLPGGLSRDFAAALRAREQGFRAVSVRDAVCYVPRSQSVRKEYRRKVRTIARGMRTLWHVRSQLNPFRYGTHAWMLVSHKICRWLLPWAALAALLALFRLAPQSGVAAALVVAVIVGGALALVGWLMDRADAPAIFTLPAFLAVGNLAAAHALLRALRGADDAIWEPTRRGRIAAP